MPHHRSNRLFRSAVLWVVKQGGGEMTVTKYPIALDASVQLLNHAEDRLEVLNTVHEKAFGLGQVPSGSDEVFELKTGEI